jgi:hypothetical protein
MQVKDLRQLKNTGKDTYSSPVASGTSTTDRVGEILAGISGSHDLGIIIRDIIEDDVCLSFECFLPGQFSTFGITCATTRSRHVLGS